MTQQTNETLAQGTAVQVENYEPKIVAFLCRWCSYAGADLAGGSRAKYPANIRIIRVPCSCRMDPNLAIKCLERGVDGVLFSGCHPGDCHYTSGNYYARRRIMMLRKLLEFGGLDPRRVQMSWVSASEGAKWAEVVTSMVTNLRELGPTTYGEMRRSSQSLGGGSEAGDKSRPMAGSGAGMSVQATR